MIGRVTPRRIALILLACALLLSGCGDTFVTAAAIVNGEKITDQEVQAQLDLALADPQTSAQLGEGAAREERIKDATRLTLSILIQAQLVENFATAQKVEVDPQALDEQIAGAVQQAGGQAAFDLELERLGLTLDEVRENLSRQLLVEAVAARIARDEVSEAELRAAYDDRILEFTEVRISHILLLNVEQAEAVKAEATPANFARLARTRSEDPSSSARGGDLGTRRAIELPEALAQAVLRAGIDKVGGPVLTDSGYHVFLVKQRREIPFAEVKADLLSERQNDVFAAWLGEQIRTAEIRVNPRYGRLDVASGRVLPFSSTDTNAPPEVQLEP